MAFVIFSSSRSCHNCPFDYSATPVHRLCVSMVPTVRLSLLERWTLDRLACAAILVLAAHMKMRQALTGQLKVKLSLGRTKKVHHPDASRIQTLAVGFTV